MTSKHASVIYYVSMTEDFEEVLTEIEFSILQSILEEELRRLFDEVVEEDSIQPE